MSSSSPEAGKKAGLERIRPRVLPPPSAASECVRCAAAGGVSAAHAPLRSFEPIEEVDDGGEGASGRLMESGGSSPSVRVARRLRARPPHPPGPRPQPFFDKELLSHNADTSRGGACC